MTVSPSTVRLAPGVSEQVADLLQTQIVRGELAPGERIAEARVTAELGVSRGPVREALQRLEARHLVVLEPRRGARVAQLDIHGARGLLDVYSVLVIRLAERVAQQMADATAASGVAEFLRRHRQQLDEAARTGDLLAVLGACDEFLDDGARTIGNDYLRGVLERLAPAFGRLHYVALSSSTRGVRRLERFVGDLISAVGDGQSGPVAGIVAGYARDQLAEIEQVLGDET